MNTTNKLFFSLLLMLTSWFTASTAWASDELCFSILQSELVDVGDGSNMLSKNKFYYQAPPTPINNLSTGDILAVPFQATEAILSAHLISGTLPSGITLFPNGLVIVSNKAQLKSGRHSFIVETADEAQKSVRTELELVIKDESSHPDRLAFYKITPSHEINFFRNGDVLARAIDPDGPIVSALHIMGTLPPGSTLTSKGELIVQDRLLLEPNIYTAGIATVDEQGNSTFFIITVPIESSNVAEE
uniref:Uncharacterized protein n=1 Tax=Roseihalotalea indica TaxID=2867963 RepID=A0AA49GSM7_9BACT|nr:hypothetical protein K4G66_08990 [Tunicatimonas sp. TK19036]